MVKALDILHCLLHASTPEIHVINLLMTIQRSSIVWLWHMALALQVPNGGLQTALCGSRQGGKPPVH